MLAWQGVTHGYGPETVIEDFDLGLDPGRVLGLVGPSGCGKTTLLLMAGGLLEPLAGCVRNGFRRPAFVFQEARLLPWRRAVDNVAFGLKAAGMGRAERRRVAGRLALRMGLTDEDLEKFPHELSGGMRQRVALARALTVSPDLLLLDEPFSALDVGLRRQLQDLVVGEIAGGGLSAVFITHDLTEAVRVSHEIAVLSGRPGRLLRRFVIDRPHAARDDAFVYETVGGLLRDAAVAAAFRTAEDIR
ncbi:MAG: ATP-binding cassette domain-containing protein [Rhodospirillales bacterium]|nr:ATP-binding cassette domain-containing protein [Rhodospirillales bacterium]